MKKPGAELASGFGGRWTEFKGDRRIKSICWLSRRFLTALR